jgi:hypothetical protein
MSVRWRTPGLRAVYYYGVGAGTSDPHGHGSGITGAAYTEATQCHIWLTGSLQVAYRTAARESSGFRQTSDRLPAFVPFLRVLGSYPIPPPSRRRCLLAKIWPHWHHSARTLGANSRPPRRRTTSALISAPAQLPARDWCCGPSTVTSPVDVSSLQYMTQRQTRPSRQHRVHVRGKIGACKSSAR